MQPRFDRRSGRVPYSLIEQPRFRAGFDFLRLRADAGEAEAELAEWWEDFSLGTDEEREALIEQARESDGRRRVASGGSAEPAGEPAKKRRRRRRKPAGGGAAPAGEGGAPASGD